MHPGSCSWCGGTFYKGECVRCHRLQSPRVTDQDALQYLFEVDDTLDEPPIDVPDEWPLDGEWYDDGPEDPGWWNDDDLPSEDDGEDF